MCSENCEHGNLPDICIPGVLDVIELAKLIANSDAGLHSKIAFLTHLMDLCIDLEYLGLIEDYDFGYKNLCLLLVEAEYDKRG